MSWRDELDGRLQIVARATAAAPTYFEPIEVGARSLIDGGVFATNPAMCAYAEVAVLGGERPRFVLRAGHGQADAADPPRGRGELGQARGLILRKDAALDAACAALTDR